MLLINAQGEYPRFIGDLQLEHPDFKEGDALPEGWHLVEPTEYPTPGEDETVEEIAPVKDGDTYKQTFTVRPLTDDEKERRDAPKTAKAKLKKLGLTDVEIEALVSGLVR